MIKSVKNRLAMMCGLIACAVIVGFAINAAAQDASTAKEKANEMRPLYAEAGDIAEGKRLAESSCSGCHGANGISSSPGVPNLAGQRAVYLYLELRAYQSGVRGDSAMNNAVKFLNDDALVKVAAYFASLDPAQPRPPSGSAAFVPKPDALQAGKNAAATCAGCHGDDGVTKTPGMPSLAGLDPKYIVDAINDYKNGKRKNELMKSMAVAISDANAKNIALYFALQKPAPAKTPAPGDAVAGKAAAAACAGCHGEEGVSGTPTTPSLAGQDADYFAAALRAYKDGTRNNETMKGMTASLNDTAIKNLAAYYAHLQPQAPNVRKPLTMQEWVERCERCHGLNGNSTNPRFPALAGQRIDYLMKVLRAYRSGARKSPEMAAMAAGLTENDIDNLAAYFSSQRARSVLYILTPGK
jgi:cytochrome c553